MLILKPELPITEKSADQHPWARRIKDALSHRIKHAHNSVRNPEYPKKKEKIPNSNRIKFTIIGDRVTREFIYCINLVRGLYKYRKMYFEPPVIQGITTVEWPTVLSDLKIRYGGLAYCLASSVAVIVNEKFLGGEKELKELMESKFTYNLYLDYYKESIAEFAKFVAGSGRPHVYMKISIDGIEAGNFIFMLYSDILPYTCANFLRLCNQTRGGYSGTPIQRIVKDGWIQGGGFGLKETHLDCENFIIPHDRRGVLGMANSGLHIECSTQFFVLLQPAPWMAHKFVAFGQLIEGKETLDKIEAVPTWYESPNSEIIIYKTGIFNMDCHDIMINKGTNEYIDQHIEDLNELGEVFYEALLENVFLTARLRELERLRVEVEGEDGGEGEEAAAGLRETKRFNRRKEDIEKQLQSSSKQDRASRPSTPLASNRVTMAQVNRATVAPTSRATVAPVSRPTVAPQSTSAYANENNDFDVETYEPEYEENIYDHQSLVTPSLIVKPKKPFYIPLTDVPYPGEKDSHFDLKRFLQGDYCLESDLTEPAKTFIPLESMQFPSDLFEFEDSDSDNADSDDEMELQNFLKANVDRVSFAGGVVRGIGKRTPKINLFDGKQKKATLDQKGRRPRDKKVSISLPSERPTHIQIKRRQTGFVHPEDLAKIRGLSLNEDDDDDDDDDDEDEDNSNDEEGERKVRMAASTPECPPKKVARRPTPFVRPGVDYPREDVAEEEDDDEPESKPKVRIAAKSKAECHSVKRRPTAYVRAAPDDDADADDDDDDRHDRHDSKALENEPPEMRKSVLMRLLDEVKGNEDIPTLKDYKPVSEYQPRNLPTFSSNYCIKSDSESKRDQHRFLRHSLTTEHRSFDNVLNLQHGKKLARKISSDYVKTIDQIEHKIENSIRSVEYAKTRPAMSVSQYQMKNRKYQEEHKSTTTEWSTNKGLRLPGDTPLHSEEDLKDKEKEKAQEKEKAFKSLKAHPPRH